MARRKTKKSQAKNTETPETLLKDYPKLDPQRGELARAFLNHVYLNQREWWDSQTKNFLRLALSWELRRAVERNDWDERLDRYGVKRDEVGGRVK